ncbi:hypothetical protein PGT21_026231 [Puccinia graminis f. sp. tritici]|uniref:Reverse transcriptase domain-containing protein n=1 Tax=Puccinia graminis f. sp. tritici TaxID=56615 RepID=A0A5B0PJ08_PUCGR|nr:hypothetical protein PGT21_026231 [Puccinia graminis f. sp. tritici]
MNIQEWESALREAKLTDKYSDVIHGFRHGFDQGIPNYNLGPSIPYFTPPNHQSALLAQEKIEASISKEIEAGRMYGPYTHAQLMEKYEFFRSNPLGAVVNGDGSVRPINDLSFPHNDPQCPLVNSFVDKLDYATTWDDFERVSKFLRNQNKPILLALFDWEKAYRQILTMGGDNPPRISAIPWRIPARASGYPPAGADSAADGRFSAQTWRISGYPKGYPVPREAIPPGGIPPGELVYIQLVGRGSSRRAGIHTSSSEGIPPGELVYIPARRKGFLPTSWYTIQLVGRGSSRRAGIHTSSSEGIPSDELICTPARREGFLPTSWYVYQLAGRNPSRRAGCTPARREGFLPASWYVYQLVGRNPSRRAGVHISSSEGIPPDELGADIRGYPRGYPPAPAGIGQRMRMRMGMRNSAKNVSGYPHPNGYPDAERPSLAKSQWAYLMVRDFNGGILIDTQIAFGGVAGCGSFGRPADAWKELMLHEFDLITVFRWVDDNLFVKHRDSSVEMEQIVLRSETLGVKTNSSKYSPFSEEKKYIGFIWNAPRKTVRLPNDKKFQRIQQIKEFLIPGAEFSFKQVEVMVGRLTHVSYLLPQLRCYLNSLYRWMNAWVYRSKELPVPDDVRRDLEEWLSTMLSFKETQMIRNPDPTEIGWMGDASA